MSAKSELLLKVARELVSRTTPGEVIKAVRMGLHAHREAEALALARAGAERWPENETLQGMAAAAHLVDGR